MDCVIPSHSVRTFCSSIGCLSKIGKDIYIDFDPLNGITLRTINDAKSAFASFHYQPSFFEKCTAPLPPVRSSVSRTNNNNNSRKRKKKHSQSSRNSRHNGRSPSTEDEDDDDDDENDNGNDDSNEKFLCRVPVRALTAAVRPRKNVVALRITGGEVANDTDNNYTCEDENSSNNDNYNSSRLCLSFEFHILSGAVAQSSSSKRKSSDFFTKSSSKSKASAPSVLIRVIHRIGVAESDSVAAVAPKDDCSEIITSPKVLLRMLEPLRKTEEMAIIVQKDMDCVMVTSFHHGDTTIGANNQIAAQNNAILQNHYNYNASTLLKTETTIACNEFDEFDFIDNRQIPDEQQQRFRNGENNSTSLNACIPSNVNQEVVLVFSIKETMAMLQFCAQNQQQSSSIFTQQELQVSLSFHWGGKPVILETTRGGNESSFSAQLVLATLDHKLLKKSTATAPEAQAAVTEQGS